MRPPEEIFIKDFLPSLRGALAHSLRSRGYSQPKIATFLNVTQAAVSKYLSTRPSVYLSRLEEIGIPRGDVEALIDSLTAEASSGPIRATQALMSTWVGLLSRRYLCEYHRRLYPELADCEICISLGESLSPERAEVIRHLEEGVRMLEENPLIVYLAPEIGINIAEALREPSGVNDVAAVPGRIVKVRSSLRAVSRPSFGASRHLASILLSIIPARRGIRAVMNIRHDESVERALRELGIRYATTKHEKTQITEEEITRAVSMAVIGGRDVECVVDEGGVGFEPSTYIFAGDAIEAVRKASLIARAALAGRL